MKWWDWLSLVLAITALALALAAIYGNQLGY